MEERALRVMVSVLSMAWALIFAGSFVAMAKIEPSSSGFLRGMDRVGPFFGLQIAASIVATLAFFGSRGLPEGSTLRHSAKAPLLVHLAGIAVIAGVVLYVRFSS